MVYELYYWPGLQGRGEFVRLALEEAGVEYVDVARTKGVEALMRAWDGADISTPSFAPPFLKRGKLVIGQTANILYYLGEHHRLAPRADAGRLWTHQVQLTIADLVTEAHDTHHPLGGDLYYEDQKREAAKRARVFRESRIPRFLDWFETVLARNPKSEHRLVGARLSYADLSLFQVVEGLRFAFPKAMAHCEGEHRRVIALHDSVATRPRIKAYLESPRRQAFNREGIFRDYPELDG